MSILLTFYRGITFLLGPIIYGLLLKSRIRKGKESTARYTERFGYASFQRPKGSLIWFHAASNGEALSSLPVIKALHQTHPHLKFIVTSGTLTSAELLAKRLPPYALHQFVPYDVPQWLNRFLDHWQPDLFILIESEIWPNMIVETAKRQIPLIFISAQISEESVSAWQWGKSFIKDLLKRFSLILAQSQEQAERLQQVGALNAIVAGNIKFASEALTYNHEELATLQQQTGSRHIWLAASTHSGEEEMVLAAHRLLQKKLPDILLILVPRHPDRADEIIGLCKENRMQAAQRSRGDIISAATDIYLADTSGEMGLFYRVSPIVFLGGSLVKIGGHNLIEPAWLECALLHGPYMYEQKEMTRLFTEAQATMKIESSQSLAENVQMLIEKPDLCRDYAKRARRVAEAQNNVLAINLAYLEPFMKGLTS